MFALRGPRQLRLLVLAAAMAAVTPHVSAGGPSVDIGIGNAARGTPRTTHRLIVKYRDTDVTSIASRNAPIAPARMAALQAQAARHGVQMQLHRHTGAGAHVMKLDRKLDVAQVAAIAAALKATDPNIEWAEPDRIKRPRFTPNDTRFGQQWPLHETAAGIRAPQAWDLSIGSGVVVAVVDTGFRPHADLAANIVGGYDFIDDEFNGDGDLRDPDAKDPGDAVPANDCFPGAPAQDSSWHGTHVSGTVAAVTHNGSGVAGVAFGAKVLPVRVLGQCGGFDSDIADGVIWASGGSVPGVPANPNPARVINMSLGGEDICGAAMQSGITSARSRKAVVVVAAGNFSQDAALESPGNCAGVITVAATDRTGARAPYSNFGSIVDLAAPGGDSTASLSNAVLSTYNAGLTTPGADKEEFLEGTSMSTPHVAGVAALMISRNPALTPDDVENRMKANTRPFPGVCNQCGTGVLDAYAAVQAASATIVHEAESNNSFSTANPVASAALVKANVGSTSDQDYFSINLPAGKTLTVTLTMDQTTADYDLFLFDSAGRLVASSEAGAGQPDRISVINVSSSTAKAVVQVKYFSGSTGSVNGKYTLDMKL